MRILVFIVLLTCFAPAVGARAQEGVPALLGENVRETTLAHINEMLFEQRYIVYDGERGTLHNLKLQKLDQTVTRLGDDYLSGADFLDDQGVVFRVNFLVSDRDGTLHVQKAVIHEVGRAVPAVDKGSRPGN